MFFKIPSMPHDYIDSEAVETFGRWRADALQNRAMYEALVRERKTLPADACAALLDDDPVTRYFERHASIPAEIAGQIQLGLKLNRDRAAVCQAVSAAFRRESARATAELEQRRAEIAERAREIGSRNKLSDRQIAGLMQDDERCDALKARISEADREAVRWVNQSGGVSEGQARDAAVAEVARLLGDPTPQIRSVPLV